MGMESAELGVVEAKEARKMSKAARFAGNSYRLLIGDLKDNVNMFMEAISRPMNLSDDTAPRIIPFILQTINQHGTRHSLIFLLPYISLDSHQFAVMQLRLIE